MRKLLRILAFLGSLAAIAGVVLTYMTLQETKKRNREDTQPVFSIGRRDMIANGPDKAYLTFGVSNGGGNATDVVAEVQPELEPLPEDKTTQQCADEFNRKPRPDVAKNVSKGGHAVFQVTLNIPTSCSVFPADGIAFTVTFTGTGPFGAFSYPADPFTVKFQPATK